MVMTNDSQEFASKIHRLADLASLHLGRGVTVGHAGGLWYVAQGRKTLVRGPYDDVVLFVTGGSR